MCLSCLQDGLNELGRGDVWPAREARHLIADAQAREVGIRESREGCLQGFGFCSCSSANECHLRREAQGQWGDFAMRLFFL
jgi:hypothetical protein